MAGARTELLREGSPSPPDPAIEAQGLCRTFPGGGVEDLSLHVPAGTIFGFIGPSGSGKTTAVRLLIGAYRSAGGEARVLGMPPWRFDHRLRRRIGYLPQQTVLYPTLSIEGNLRFVASLYGVRRRRRARVREALRLVELDQHRKTRLRDASGGMQRRVGLAAALVHEPELLFLDEPTAGLDPILRARLWQHFAELRDRGRTLFVTTQIESEAAHCDLVALMLAGRVAVTGTPDELRRAALGGDVLRIRGRSPFTPEVAERAGRLGGVLSARLLADPSVLEVVADSADAVRGPLDAVLREHLGIAPVVERHLPSFDQVFVSLVERAARPDGAYHGGGPGEPQTV